MHSFIYGDGRLMTKITIQLCEIQPKLSYLKFLLLTYGHIHFLATVHIFFHHGFLGPRTFFTAWLFWIRFHHIVMTALDLYYCIYRQQ